MEDNDLVPGGVYKRKGDPDNRQSIMSTFRQRGESVLGLLFDDGGRVPVRKHRGGIGDSTAQFELVARPVPVDVFRVILKLVELADDIIELAEAHRKKKAK